MATDGRGDNPDKCAVCLDDYNQPKFLPCYHTFCARCIQSVADRRNGRNFPCPACRRVTSLPPGGVKSLQTNFYIKPPSSQPNDMCQTHSDQKLVFYCKDCEIAICLFCKLTEHEGHPTEDLSTAASRQKEELLTHQERVQEAVSKLKDHTTFLKEQQQSLVKKTKALVANIHGRHAMLIAAADKERDNTLLALKARLLDINNELELALQQDAEKMDTLSAIQQRVNNAVRGESHSNIIAVTKEMRNGRGSEDAVKALTQGNKRRKKQMRQLIFRSIVNTDVMIKVTRGYLGNVTDLDTEVSDPDMTVTDRFKCGDKAEVFSLCHEDSDTPRVCVSFDRVGLEQDVNVEVFSETGQSLESDDTVGKVSYKRYEKGEIMKSQQPGKFITFNKTLSAHFRLDNNLSGQASVLLDTITSSQPFKAKTTTQFTIEVGPHRAFDTNKSGQCFVVVEEAANPSSQRSVRLYKKHEKKAIATYRPPTPQFQPSDICFFNLLGREVLLITDELNDAIHVVAVQDGDLKFERYLCGGCPSLVQPTAITVDVHNRLWVACRGGAVFTIEHK